jgi:hypothetical protein
MEICLSGKITFAKHNAEVRDHNFVFNMEENKEQCST